MLILDLRKVAQSNTKAMCDKFSGLNCRLNISEYAQTNTKEIQPFAKKSCYLLCTKVSHQNQQYGRHSEQEVSIHMPGSTGGQTGGVVLELVYAYSIIFLCPMRVSLEQIFENICSCLLFADIMMQNNPDEKDLICRLKNNIGKYLLDVL